MAETITLDRVKFEAAMLRLTTRKSSRDHATAALCRAAILPDPPADALVADWLQSAPLSVKRMFGGSITVRNFWREERNRSFQMQGVYDGSISDECKSVFQEYFEICDTIIKVSREW